MSRRLIAVGTIILAAVIVVGGVVWYRLHPSVAVENAARAPAIGKARVGAVAPSFTIATTHGSFDLATIRKPVFLEIFATWCPHCQHEAPIIQRLYERYGSRVSFLAVPGSTTGMDGTSPESPEDVLAFAMRFHVTYPIALYDPTLSIANAYLQGGFPTIAIIAPDKRIVYLTSGETPYATLAATLDSVLHEKSSSLRGSS